MGPNETKHIKLDLKAEIVGNYTSSVSSAYLYYTNESKSWQEGINVIINE
jgi:hypothetical protein